jgi:hypothetical protein
VKRIAVLLVILAAALAANAGSARAGWCGETADVACDSSLAYVECAGGTIWLIDPTLVDADLFGEITCTGGYTVLTPPPPPSSTETAPEEPSGPYDLDPNMTPDPSEYVGEVQCPDGRIWAVARGDRFTCPP